MSRHLEGGGYGHWSSYYERERLGCTPVGDTVLRITIALNMDIILLH